MRYYVEACPNHTSTHVTRLSVKAHSAHECAQLKTTLFSMHGMPPPAGIHRSRIGFQKPSLQCFQIQSWLPKQYSVLHLVMLLPWLLIFKFCPISFKWWPWTLTLKFSKMLYTAPVSLFEWQMFVKLWLHELWSCGDLDLWPLDLNFKKMLDNTSGSLFHWLKLLNGVVTQKLYFCPYLVMWRPWPLTLKFSEMFHTILVSLFHWWNFLSSIFEWSEDSRLYFCLNMVMWWPWP